MALGATLGRREAPSVLAVVGAGGTSEAPGGASPVIVIEAVRFDIGAAGICGAGGSDGPPRGPGRTLTDPVRAGA